MNAPAKLALARPTDREVAEAYPEIRWQVLPASWAAERLAMNPARLATMIRAEELLALPARASIGHEYPPDLDYLIPPWQFAPGSTGPHPALPTIVAAAAAAGWNALELHRFMREQHDGVTPASLLHRGEIDEVIARIEAAAASDAPPARADRAGARSAARANAT